MVNQTDADQQQKGVLTSATAFFHEHPALLGSLVYVQITSVGIIYSWTLYRSFGINTFDFAEANDFLLASLKEPFPFVMSVVTVILFGGVQVVYLMFLRRRRDRSRFLESRMNYVIAPSFVITIIGYTILPPYIFANRHAISIHEDKTPHVMVRYTAESRSQDNPSHEVELTLIGTSEKFAFFYDKAVRRTLALPLTNIQSITFPATGS